MKHTILAKKWEPHDMPMTPHLVFPALEAGTRVLNKITGFSFRTLAYYIENNQGRWVFAEEDLQRLGEDLFNAPRLVIDLSHRWKQFTENFDSICAHIKNLPDKSDNDLSGLYKRFYIAYLIEYSIPMLSNAFDYYFEKWIAAKVENYEDYISLTTSNKESFTIKEVRELTLIEKDENFCANIKKHAKKYFWLENNYLHTKMLGPDYFIQRHNSEKYVKHQTVRKKRLMKKYLISDDLMKAVEECIFWRDERKKYNMIGSHYLSILLEEIGRRNKISIDDMKYTLPNEILNINTKRIKERKEAILIVGTINSFKIYSGANALSLKHYLYPKDNSDDGTIKGTPACLGYAKGHVKVVFSEKDFAKMNTNDVLVTSMTRPEFVPLMKKASAIVTDEGGITCHAAIVSRELNKPCIIGTKNATQLLKDNDVVVVDANVGKVYCNNKKQEN
jgi:phosphohistidine swiveling domain-containing protein